MFQSFKFYHLIICDCKQHISHAYKQTYYFRFQDNPITYNCKKNVEYSGILLAFSIYIAPTQKPQNQQFGQINSHIKMHAHGMKLFGPPSHLTALLVEGRAREREKKSCDNLVFYTQDL